MGDDDPFAGANKLLSMITGRKRTLKRKEVTQDEQEDKQDRDSQSDD